ncbi:MAG: hypothetical protein MUC50_03405 [Myxococcota bacterium]|jgi:hypothetical protein|nr:hypothetical protein [Myxococcota bacterium]
MRNNRISWILLCVLAAGCGGAGTGETNAPAEQRATVAAVYREGPGPKLAKAELCTAVDEARMRPAAAPTTQFRPDDRTIFLVGKLKDVEEGVKAEVRWYLNADSEPQLVSVVEAEKNFTFLASYSPTEPQFFVGAYTVRIYVGGIELASLPFTVERGEEEKSSLSVKRVEFGTDLDAQGQIKKPSKSFRDNVFIVYSSFDVSGAEFGSALTIRWTKGDELVHQEELKVNADKRYTTELQTMAPLPRSSYVLEIKAQGAVLARGDFTVGDANKASPRVNRTDLGLGIGKDNQPKQKTSVFKKNANILFLGVMFADIPPGSTMEVSWIGVSKQGDTTHYIARSVLERGGEGTFGVTWEPKIMLEPGNYKAVVSVAGETLAEVPFKVK